MLGKRAMLQDAYWDWGFPTVFPSAVIYSSLQHYFRSEYNITTITFYTFIFASIHNILEWQTHRLWVSSYLYTFRSTYLWPYTSMTVYFTFRDRKLYHLIIKISWKFGFLPGHFNIRSILPLGSMDHTVWSILYGS